MKAKGVPIILVVIVFILVALPITRDEFQWILASQRGGIHDYQAYMSSWPEGRHSDECKELIYYWQWKENSIEESKSEKIIESHYFKPNRKSKNKYTFYSFSKDIFLFKIKDTELKGYLAFEFRDNKTLAGFLPFIFIYEFIESKGSSYLASTGTIKIEDIKVIEIIEEARGYYNKFRNSQIVESMPYFKANIMLRDNRIYPALMNALDMVKACKKTPEFSSGGMMLIENSKSIHTLQKGMILTNIN